MSDESRSLNSHAAVVGDERSPDAVVAPGQQWTNIAVTLACCLLLAALMIPFILGAQQDARRLQSKNKLKQLGLAFHNYHDVHQQFPVGADVRPDGTAIHGWVIRLIPYLESSPLYSQINWNFPWDHPANSHLFRFRHPSLLSPNHGDQFTSEGFGLLHYPGNPNVLHRNTTTCFSEMTTGTAHNWLVGEVSGRFQPFAYPFNWRELKLPFNDGQGSYGSVRDSTNICLADGSVKTLSQKTDQEVVRQLANAPPVSSDESKAFPPKVFTNRASSSWTREYFLAAAEDDGIKNKGSIGTTLDFDPQGQLDTAILYVDSNGEATCAVDRTTRINLFSIVKAHPEVRVLILNTVLNDDAVAVIVSCSRIEIIVASRIQLSDSSRERLQQHRTLKWAVLTSGAQHAPADIPGEFDANSSNEF